ncbi:hypothetical protein ACNE9Y_31005 [Pseudomonas sp. NY11226]|uniref:hypothetical protein n=1 Tax=Pseudomonas sp. NY11226 TaxID=3400362 RepID=UPI003A840353
MNSLKLYIGSGLAVVGALISLSLLLKFLIAFDYLEPKHAGLFYVCGIATLIAMAFLFLFITDIEHFNTTMMVVSMAAGTILIISSLGFGGIIYSIFFNGFCKVLEKAGFYKALYRGIGNVLGSILGSALSTVYKPKVNKYSKYL